MARKQTETYKKIIYELQQWIVTKKNQDGYITQRDYINIANYLAVKHSIKEGSVIRVAINDTYNKTFFINDTSKYYIDFHGSDVFVNKGVL